MKNNINLAKRRARSVKMYLRDIYPQIESKRIKLSWFDEAESIKTDSAIFKKNESVQFLTKKM